MNIAEVVKHFEALLGGTFLVFPAPGRVNIIGEHTDYNDGFVMPGAWDFQHLWQLPPVTTTG